MIRKVIILDFVTRFEENLVCFVKRHDLIRNGEKILIAVSGGKDSMALLYALNKIKEKLGIDIIAIHMDHMLREDSWKEKVTIAEFTEKIGVDFVSEKRNVLDFLKMNPGYSVEEAARLVRYGYFLDKLEELKGDKIALAHHKDDRIENFFLMLFRGAGIHGLSSMKIKNSPFIRPLMFTNKAEIERYVNQNSIPHVEDYTNYDTSYQRNKVRLIFLPFVKKKICKDTDKKVFRTIKILEDYSDFIEKYSKDLFKSLQLHINNKSVILDYNQLAMEHPVMIVEIVRTSLRYLKGNMKGLNYEKLSKIVELIKGGKNFEYDLGDSVKIFKSYDKIFIMRDLDLTLKKFSYKIENEGVYNIEEADIILEFRISKALDFKILDEENIEVFDHDKIKWPIFVRNRNPGDKMKPLGFQGHRKVKNILNEMKIPNWLKNKVLILQDSSGRIMWLSGFRISEDFKIDQSTEKFLILKVLKGGIFNKYEFKR